MSNYLDGTAMKIIGFAREEAIQLRSASIGSAHLLIAILRMSEQENDKQICDVVPIECAGARSILAELRSNTAAGESSPNNDCLDFDSEAQAILRMAGNMKNRAYLGMFCADNLLLAILRLKDCLAHKILELGNVDVVKLESALLNVIEVDGEGDYSTHGQGDQAAVLKDQIDAWSSRSIMAQALGQAELAAEAVRQKERYQRELEKLTQ